MRSTHRIVAMFLAFAILAAPAAFAAEVCVSNQDQFAAAVIEAEFAPLTIELVQGSYEIAGTVFDNTFATFQGFSLLGGYTANCASRTIDPDNTTIDVANGAAFYADVVGNVTVEGLRFSGAGAGIRLDWDDDLHDIPASVSLVFRRNIVSGATDGGVGFDWIVGGSQAFSARIVENQIDHNNGSNCALELDGEEGADATYTVINNTIMDNTVGDGGMCAGRYSASESSVFAFNNILYGNAGYDLAVKTPLQIYNNVIGTHYPYPAFTLEFSTLSADPELDAFFHPIESPASPVINSGDDNVPGGLPAHDLDGGPRVVGSTVDRGAYESSIDDEYIQTVTNTNDSGNGSLRAAIASVDANGGGLIRFDIGSGCGPHVILLASALPAITVPAIINGYTQTGASQNDLGVGDDATICVILENDASVPIGLQVPANAGDAASLTVKGLAFSGFYDAAIDLQGGSAHAVLGNHLGGNVGGHALQPNGIGIRLGTATHDAIIGSDDVAGRNIVGDAASDGIFLQGGTSGSLAVGANNNQIVNNYVGIGWAVGSGSYTNRANGSNGIRIDGHDNTILGNVIGDNVIDGVLLNGDGAIDNLIRYNAIGVDSVGTNLGNGNMGVRTQSDAHDNRILDNTIADNGQKGVRIVTGRGNRIRRNSIYGNAYLGIDLASAGVTANDDDGAIQPSDYANRGQNYPVLSFAGGGYAKGYVAGTLTSTPGDYTIDLYLSSSCDKYGNGDGETWLRAATVTIPTPQVGDQATVAFNLAIREPLIVRPFVSGAIITATATDASGDTSEFSACASYVNDTIFVDGFEAAPL